MNYIFVDTGAWIACMVSRDRYHSIASAYMKEIQEKRIPLMTSNYVISETITWLKYKTEHRIAREARDLLRELEGMGVLKVQWVTPEIVEDAWWIFDAFPEERLSLTDCTSIAICRRFQIEKVFTFDVHFNIVGKFITPGEVHESGVEYRVTVPPLSIERAAE